MNIIKMTALVLCAIALLAGCAVRAVQTRVLHIPWGLPAWVGLALLLAFTAAAVTAPVTSTGVLGAYGRNSGLLTYASALVLFLVGLRVFDRDGTRVVLYALMLAGAFTASYGLLQYAGLDPVPWANTSNPIIAAMGNPNFAAAYVAICSPAAAWGVLRTGWPFPWRIASGVVLVLCLTAAVLSDAAQGPIAAASGLAVLAVVWLLDRPPHLRRRGFVACAAAAVVGVAAIAAGAAGVGPAARAFDSGSLARVWHWQAALSMWQDRPILGVGLETFGPFWRTERSLEAVRVRGTGSFSDAAHSVPLHLLATGGLLLALAYTAFVLVTALALLFGLRNLRDEERALLGALGGGWTAYQVQSLVSIEQVPLVTTHYVLASAVFVAAGRVRLREVRLRGAPPLVPVKPGRKRRVQERARRRLLPADLVAVAVIGLATLVVASQALAPLRANAAALAGDTALARGHGAEALLAYDSATGLVPGEPRYWRKKAHVHEALGQNELALSALLRAVRSDPLDLDAVRRGAAVAEDQSQVELARSLYEQALKLDLLNPDTILAVARFELGHAGAGRARSILEEAVAAFPEYPELWGGLGDARRELADLPGARQAYQRALALEPDQDDARAGLSALEATARSS